MDLLVTLVPKLLNLKEASGMAKAWNPEDVLSPPEASNLYDLYIWVIWNNVLVLDETPEQSDRLSYHRLDLCLVKSFLVPSITYGFGQESFVYHLKLSPDLSTASTRHAC